MIVFQLKSGGDVPFKAVLTSLMDDKSLGWHLLKQKDELKEAKFRIKRAFDMKMIGNAFDRPISCLEIRVAQVGDTELFLQDVCVEVRETFERKLKAVCPKEQYFLAFFCTCSQTSATHMMKVDDSTFPYTHAVCLHAPLDQKLSEDTHLFWFVSPDRRIPASEIAQLRLPLYLVTDNMFVNFVNVTC